ncbi:VirB3 family type IV secretion system protein [Luteimonas sp. SX5]|uniref:VirB3 family type IV secretion system protein n=1 Tax=Luteimonas galliterrae TaxID=2940486 RepID=A0ABT0MKJ7_9GAMM|nr:VirB3 family type IV secretion system protein [Luteimonas galliterrae]MCL1635113.1 VirB3 family type IV secretion system protein [Luteimonas galliterrae]
MHRNALFRGCTRPAMFMGVPYVPFFIGAGSCLLLAMYFDMFLLLLIPPVIFVMRQMARRDEMVFRLLGLRWQFKFKAKNLNRNAGMWVFSPNAYRPRPGAADVASVRQLPSKRATRR